MKSIGPLVPEILTSEMVGAHLGKWRPIIANMAQCYGSLGRNLILSKTLNLIYHTCICHDL